MVSERLVYSTSGKTAFNASTDVIAGRLLNADKDLIRLLLDSFEAQKGVVVRLSNGKWIKINPYSDDDVKKWVIYIE